MLTIPTKKALQTVYSVAKVYPDTLKVIFYSTPRIMLQQGLETQKQTTTKKTNRKPSVQARIDSIRRTKTAISDIVLCNDFDLFCTFTFKKDRENIDFSKRKMSDWLRDQRKKLGKFDYIIVPEFHKDGKAIHFHALLKGYTGKLHKTNIFQKGRQVYNITSYKKGYTTAVFIDNKQKVSSYIRKYITKDMPTFSGKKRYWTSKNLVRPNLIRNPAIENIKEKQIISSFTIKDFTIITYSYNMKIH